MPCVAAPLLEGAARVLGVVVVVLARASVGVRLLLLLLLPAAGTTRGCITLVAGRAPWGCLGDCSHAMDSAERKGSSGCRAWDKGFRRGSC